MTFLIVLFFSFTLASCANILALFPVPFYSHLKFQEKMLKTLLDRGHTVTALVEGTLKQHENLTQYNLNCGDELRAIDTFKFKDVFEGFVFIIMALPTIRQQLAMREVEIVKEMIRRGNESRFDLVISESHSYFILNQFAELYDCPIVISSPMDVSSHIHYAMGNELNPTMVSETLAFPYDANTVTLWQRIKGTLCTAFLVIGKPFWDTLTFYVVKSHYRQAKESQIQIEEMIALVITNTHQALGFVRPETNRIHVGFLDMEQPKSLPDGALKDFVDTAEKGIILVNFGSMIKTTSFPETTTSALFKVFASLQYRVIWKYDDAELANVSKNIFLSSWLPQIDLLGHPKVKLFVTHGGLNSVQESIEHKVPMLILPVSGDQLFNSQFIGRKECGVVLDHNDVTEKTLLESISRALEPKYKENVEQLREIVYSYPMTSRETLVWWIEQVLKHKGLDYMKYPGRKVSFYRKYYFDLMAYVVATIFMVKIFRRIVSRTNTRHTLRKLKIT